MLSELFARKVEAELARAGSLVRGASDNAVAGERFPEVAFVKGTPGPAELSGAPVMSGLDGAAAAKAIERLGFDPDSTFAVLSRPTPDATDDEVASRLRQVLEAVDPLVIVATDDEARGDLGRAFGVHLVFGRPVELQGRVALAVDGLEASLVDDSLKRRVWRQMKSLTPRRSLDLSAKPQS